MAADALNVFQTLNDYFFRYYATPFAVADEGVERERERLLNRDGVVWREPWIEPLREFRGTGRSLDESCRAVGANQDLAAFARAGLIPGGIDELYLHQEDVLAATIAAALCFDKPERDGVDRVPHQSAPVAQGHRGDPDHPSFGRLAADRFDLGSCEPGVWLTLAAVRSSARRWPTTFALGAPTHARRSMPTPAVSTPPSSWRSRSFSRRLRSVRGVDHHNISWEVFERIETPINYAYRGER